MHALPCPFAAEGEKKRDPPPRQQQQQRQHQEDTSGHFLVDEPCPAYFYCFCWRPVKFRNLFVSYNISFITRYYSTLYQVFCTCTFFSVSPISIFSYILLCIVCATCI